MAQRRGSLLENNVGKIFQLAGLKPEMNVKINGYEIDVYLEYMNQKLVIECKQYERSQLFVRNLIHQWESKNKIIKADRVLLVIVGSSVSDKDRKFAKRYRITIWDDDDFEKYFDLAIKKKSKIRNEIIQASGLIAIDVDSMINSLEYILNCSKDDALALFNGESKLSTFMKDNVPFDKKTIRRAINNDTYYGIPLINILEIMKKYNIRDKKIALLLINKKGGKDSKGNSYTEDTIQLVSDICEDAGIEFEDAIDLISKPIKIDEQSIQHIMEQIKCNRGEAILILNNAYNEKQLRKITGIKDIKEINEIINDSIKYRIPYKDLSDIYEANLSSELYNSLINCITEIIYKHNGKLKIKTRYLNNRILKKYNKKNILFLFQPFETFETFEIFAGSIEKYKHGKKKWPVLRFSNENVALKDIPSGVSFQYIDSSCRCVIINDKTIDKLEMLMMAEIESNKNNTVNKPESINKMKNKEKIQPKSSEKRDDKKKMKVYADTLGMIGIATLIIGIFVWQYTDNWILVAMGAIMLITAFIIAGSKERDE